MLYRPLAALSLSYITGIIMWRIWMESPILIGFAVAVLVTLGAIAYFREVLSFFMGGLLLIVIGAGAAATGMAMAPSPGGALQYTGIPVYVEGTVVEEPRFDEGSVVYRVNAEVVETGEGRFPVGGGLLVRVYHGDEAPGYWYGERLRLRGEIVEPKGRRNPGGFDYRLYLKTQGLEALMYLQPHQVDSVGDGEVGWLASTAFSLRSRMVEGIETNLPSPHAELLTAILFGQRHRLPENIQENFTRAGAGHLMAVSGLHVGLVAGLIFFLLKPFGRNSIPVTILAVLLLFFYAYITGMRPPALRAAIMFSLGMAAFIWEREKDFPNALALAALTTLIYNPLLLFSVGFQLSYAATLSIFYLSPLFDRYLFGRLPFYLRRLISIIVAAQLSVLPLTAYYFHQVALLGILFNILIIPVMALLLGLGLLGSLVHLLSPFLASIFFMAVYPLLVYLEAVTGLSRISWVYHSVVPPRITLLVLYYAIFGALAVYFYRAGSLKDSLSSTFFKFREYAASFIGKMFHSPGIPYLRNKVKVVLVVSMIILIVFWSGAFRKPATLAVTFIDVGQGLAVFMETSCGLKIMYDGGGTPEYRGEVGQVGDKVLIPFLHYRGVKELDLVIISHPHEDHFGGFIPLFDRFKVKNLMISPVEGGSLHYDLLLQKAESAGTLIEKVQEGDSFILMPEHSQVRRNLRRLLPHAPGGRIYMKVLSPPANLYRGTGSDLNNNSLVVRVLFGQVGFLFTGDIEEAAVRGLLDSRKDLRSLVLQVPHHGGYLPPLEPFLEAVSPEVAVIPVGINPFGHPHAQTISTLESSRLKLFRNDHHGAVILKTDGRSLWWKTMISPAAR